MWLKPDAGGTILSPYDTMRDWVRSMHDVRGTKGMLENMIENEEGVVQPEFDEETKTWTNPSID